jgi:hypothetical protein
VFGVRDLNAAHWLKELYVLPTFVDDEKSVVVEDKLILTTVPFSIREKARLLLLERERICEPLRSYPGLSFITSRLSGSRW